MDSLTKSLIFLFFSSQIENITGRPGKVIKTEKLSL